MFSGKIWRVVLLLVGMTYAGVSPLMAQVNGPAVSFAAQVQPDALAIAQFVNAPFAKSMGFITTLGWNTPPGIFDFMAGPRIEVGVGAAVDLMNFPSLSSLALPALEANTNITIPSVLPFPVPAATARVGLMNGLDVGVRFAYLPMVDIPELGFAANFVGWGVDLRYKIIEGLYLPTVSVGMSWDTFSGNLGISTKVNQSSTYSNSGTDYNATLAGTTSYALNWNVRSFGAKIEVGKDLGILYPFGAIGFQRSSGGITSSLTGNGTVTMSDDPGDTASVNFAASTTSAPEVLEPKFVLGIDIGQGLHWAVVGESNGVDIAGSTSFRAQF